MRNINSTVGRINMTEETEIQMKAWNSTTSTSELTGESISIYSIARSMTLINFTKLLDEFLNLSGKGFPEGKKVGLDLRFTHRTMQRLVICFSFGIIVGLAEQEFTDPRNEIAIQTAKKVAEMIKNNELSFGFFI